MRCGLGIVVATLLGACCSRTPGPRSVATDPPGNTATLAPGQGTAATNQTDRAGASPRYPIINPITPVQGRVTFVNEKLRFVIVDFAFHQMPRLEQRLGLYREGERVGEVRISGPAEGTAIVGDVMSGDAAIGDQARGD